MQFGSESVNQVYGTFMCALYQSLLGYSTTKRYTKSECNTVLEQPDNFYCDKLKNFWQVK